MNKANILLVAEAVERSNSYSQEIERNPCGGPGCVIGHARDLMREEIVAPEKSWAELLEWLGITDEQGMAIYDPCPYYPFRYGGPPTKEQAAAMLRRLAETGEVDWHGA